MAGQDNSNSTNFESSLEENEDGVVYHDGQLFFIGQNCNHIPPQLINSTSQVIKRLDLTSNKLISLRGVENLHKLEELILDNNEISDGTDIPSLPRLHTLTLNKNKITDLDRLLDKLVKRTPVLRYLSLLGNEACPNQLSNREKDEEDYQRYRHYVLYRLPNLKFLDSTQVTELEKKEAKRLGPYLKVVRPKDDSVYNHHNEERESPSAYTPLPSRIREEPDHKASFGQCKYVYYGRHSEGNRFIKNNDL